QNTDRQGGLYDLRIPNHETESAHTLKPRRRELARICMHNGMLVLAGEKMAKSVGNITPLHEAIAQWGRDALILFFVSGHYRGPLTWSDAALRQAQANVQTLRDLARRLTDGDSPPDLAPLRDRFFAALADDFGTPAALAAMWEWVREVNRRGEPA